MKVCFVVGTLGRGGAERQLVFMIRALKYEGIDIKVLSLTSGEALEAEIRDLGIEVQWVGASPSRIVRLFRVIKAIREYRPDIIQSAHFYTNLYAALAGRVLRTRNTGAIRNDLTSEVGADRIFGKWQFKLPSALIANSKQAQERATLLDRRRRKIELVRNVVELPEANGGRVSAGSRAVRIIFVGRLLPQKRPDIFIKLAGRLLKEMPYVDLSFKIVGDGALRTELERICDELAINKARIEFLGEQAEMSSIYHQADILVSTSLYEGMPNVVLEAMAHSLPVVATRVGGVPEILSGETGVIVDPSDFDALANAVKGLVLDAGRREILGRNGKAHVTEHHSISYLRQRLPMVYRQLLRSN